MSIRQLAQSIVAATAMLAMPLAMAETNRINMAKGVTEVGAQIYDLHMLIFWICVVIGVAVFAVMLYSIFYHRKSRGVTPATFHESTKVEVLWTIIPFFILIGMAVPATSTLLEVYNNDDVDRKSVV